MSIKPLHQYPLQPMNEDQAMALFGLAVNSRSPEWVTETSEQLKDDFLIRLITSRAEYHDLKLEFPVVLALAVLSEGVPGRVVMYLHSLASVTPVEETVNLDKLCFTFAEGFPNEADCSACWDAQKAENGTNRLDNKEEWIRP